MVYMYICVDTKREEGTAGCGWSEWRPVRVSSRTQGGVSALLVVVFFFAGFFTVLV